MKYLIIHHCDSWGGAGVSLKLTCEMLMESGVDVTVCLPHKGTEVYNQLSKINNLNIISIERDLGMIAAYNGGPSFFSRTFFSVLSIIPSCKRALKKVLERESYDLIILNSMTLSWVCRLTSSLSLKSIVYIRETKPPFHPGFQLIRSYINRYATGVVFISAFDKKRMRLECSCQLVMPNSIHLSDFVVKDSKQQLLAKYALPNDSMILLYVGGDDKLKGYDILLKAIERLQGCNIKIIVVGPVRDENKKNNIIYLGKVYDMSSIYQMSDVLVFPSIKGHQARPAFEAGACYVPVIISDFPETSDEIIDGYNGLTFTPLDPENLAEKIMVLYSNPELRRKYGVNNYKETSENHNYEINKQKLTSFLESTIARQ